MIKVAFCDDDLSVLTEIKTLLEQYCVKCNQKIKYAAFHSSFELSQTKTESMSQK